MDGPRGDAPSPVTDITPAWPSRSAEIATEIRIYSYEAEVMPGWREAKQLVAEHGLRLDFTRSGPKTLGANDGGDG